MAMAAKVPNSTTSKTSQVKTFARPDVAKVPCIEIAKQSAGTPQEKEVAAKDADRPKAAAEEAQKADVEQVPEFCCCERLVRRAPMAAPLLGVENFNEFSSGYRLLGFHILLVALIFAILSCFCAMILLLVTSRPIAIHKHVILGLLTGLQFCAFTVPPLFFLLTLFKKDRGPVRAYATTQLLALIVTLLFAAVVKLLHRPAPDRQATTTALPADVVNSTSSAIPAKEPMTLAAALWFGWIALAFELLAVVVACRYMGFAIVKLQARMRSQR